ncbi:MAG: LysE family translocator [Acetobacterales bacterium]
MSVPLVDPAALGAFVVAALAIVLSPGPDTMLILRHALGHGRRAGFAAVAGVQAGLLTHTALSVAGLSVALASSPRLFGAIAAAGALWLGWLGIQAMRGGALPDTAARTGNRTTALSAGRDAMLTNLLNLKVLLLFLALMPNFVAPARGDVPAQLALLGAVLIAVNVLWQVGLVLAADAMRRLLTNPRVARRLSQATGAVLLGFAALLVRDYLLPG